jgi:hypothetical protein
MNTPLALAHLGFTHRVGHPASSGTPFAPGPARRSHHHKHENHSGGERAQTLRPSRDERRAGSLHLYTIKERGYGTHPDRALSLIDRGGSDRA